MFDRLGEDELVTALEEMIALLGVKEDVPCDDLVALLQTRNAEGCVQEIAARLELPICVNLSYVSKDFRPGDTDRFHSTALARTDWTGRGMEGITAQVFIPQDLPMFGTASLQGYPIRVRVSENCHAHPHAFVAIMVHELSHVLLASLRSSRKDSELHVDLVPILLGFRDVVRRGRKIVEVTTSGDTTTMHTTTYGYLTDSQFEFACNHVMRILERHQRDKRHLLGVVKRVRRRLGKAARHLSAFGDYFDYLDRRRPDRMRPEHARRLVDLHAQDHARQWEGRIEEIRRSTDAAEAFARRLIHYKPGAVEDFRAHARAVALASDELDRVAEAIAENKRILARYVGFLYRFQGALRRRFKDLSWNRSGPGDRATGGRGTPSRHA
jgi:hypothetical protein